MDFKELEEGYKKSLFLIKTVDEPAFKVAYNAFKRIGVLRMSAFMASVKHTYENKLPLFHKTGMFKGKHNLVSVAYSPVSQKLIIQCFSKKVFRKQTSFTLVIPAITQKQYDESDDLLFAYKISNLTTSSSVFESYVVNKLHFGGYRVDKANSSWLVGRKKVDAIEMEETELTNQQIGY